MLTVEKSVRTALISGLGTDRPAETDDPGLRAVRLRVIVANLKASFGIDEISLSALLQILRSGPSLKLAASGLKNMPRPPM